MLNAAGKQLGIQPEVIRKIDKHEFLHTHDLHVWQSFMYQDSVTKQWHPVVITSLCQEKRSYKITTTDGLVYRRLKHISNLIYHRTRSHKQCSQCHNWWHNQIICSKWNNQRYNLTTRSLHKWTINHKYIQADLKGTVSPMSSLIYKYFMFTLCIRIYIMCIQVFKSDYGVWYKVMQA